MKARYITPAVTVMGKDGTIDFEGCGKVYEHLIEGGVDGILLLGSIGEFFALTMEQKKELIRFAVDKIAHRTQLIVGTTSMVFGGTALLCPVLPGKKARMQSSSCRLIISR